MLNVSDIKNNFASVGNVEWIGLRVFSDNKYPDKQILHVKSVEALKNHGLVGDKAGQKAGGKRQVSLIQFEHLPVIAALLKKKNIDPAVLRRNIVVSGINLATLKNMQIKIQDTIIEITGNCAPCTKMEQVLGHGGFNAMRNHGGVTGKIIQGGLISLGDEVEVLIENKTKNAEMHKTESNKQNSLF